MSEPVDHQEVQESGSNYSHAVTGEIVSAGGFGAATTPQPARGAEPLTRAQAFAKATATTPKNDYGLPIVVHRPDLIPGDIMERSDDERMEILQCAMVDIHYDQGYPTFSDGTAFWGQMEFEPTDAYDLFKAYLEQGEFHGVRQLEILYDEMGKSRAALIDGPERQRIREYSIFFNWAIRCKAFDLFQVAAHQKLREKRILSSTDRHYLMAEGLMGKVTQFFQEVDEDGNPKWMEGMSTKVAIDMMDKLVRIQRMSLGLGSNGNGASEDGPKNADVSVVLRQIAAQGADPAAGGVDDSNKDLSVLLNDPEMAGMAQELIIKVGEANRK